MNKIMVLTLFSFIGVLVGCNNDSEQKKLARISNELNEALSQKQLIFNELRQKPDLFTQEKLKSFPDNRAELERLADEKINKFNEIIRIDEFQIEKLNEAENITSKSDLLEFFKNSRQIVFKTIELYNVRIQNYRLFKDKNISTRQQLEEKLLIIKKRQTELELEIDKLQKQQKVLE